MIEQELIPQTIDDLKECRDKILERHKNNPTLSLRLDNVFKQLISSLNVNAGYVISNQDPGFKPQPLTNVFGKEIKVKKNVKLSLKKLVVDDKEAFREKIQLIYDSLLGRDTVDLIESLEEIEIRGVAKIAGVENFDKLPIDGVFIDSIKSAITAKQELEKKQEEERLRLEEEEKDKQSAITAKQELEKKVAKK